MTGHVGRSRAGLGTRFWATIGVAAVATGTLAAFAGGAAASTGTSTGWAATQTKAVVLKGKATDLGALGPDTVLHLSLALTVRNAAEMASTAIAASTPGSSTFGHYLTPAEVRTRFGPTATEADAVASWLRGAGFSSVSVESDRLFVEATGTAATAEKAFDTALTRYRWDGHTLYENTEAAMVPSQFGGEVLAVLGLSDMPMTLPHVVRSSNDGPAVRAAVARLHLAGTAATTPDTSGFTPQQLATIYDASSLPQATKTATAVVVSGDMTSTIADLRYAEKENKAATAPVSVVYTAPEAGIVDGNPYTGNLEWDLDTQMSTQIAGNVSHEYLYDIATIDDSDVSRAINEFVEQRKALTLSASLGECDVQPFLDGAMVATDQVVEEGALQGQSFFASSGDNGFACPEVASTGVPGGVPGVSWPADGTWTTGVGGTTLDATSAGVYQEEVSWVGGGGGVSEFEIPGNWTATANAAAQAAEYTQAGTRGVPDIAADADDVVSPVVIWQNKASNLVGGTSVSSPLSMGLWARIQTAHANKLGVASIDFYTLYNKVNKVDTEPQTEPAGFHDITVGSNGLYTALPGYDYTTGIGSFDAAVLSKQL